MNPSSENTQIRLKLCDQKPDDQEPDSIEEFLLILSQVNQPDTNSNKPSLEEIKTAARAFIESSTESSLVHLTKILFEGDEDQDPWLPDGASSTLIQNGVMRIDDTIFGASAQVLELTAAVWEELARRASKDADSESRVITPLLVHMFSGVFTAAAAERTNPGHSGARLTDTSADPERAVLEAFRTLTPIGPAMTKLETWVHGVADPGQLEWLKDIWDMSITAAVARQTPVAKNGDGVTFLAAVGCFSSVARNPFLDDKGRVILIDAYIEAMHEGGVYNEVLAMSGEINKRGWVLSKQQVDRISDAVNKEIDAEARALADDNSGWAQDDSMTGFAREIAAGIRQVLETPDLAGKLCSSENIQVHKNVLKNASGRILAHSLAILADIADPDNKNDVDQYVYSSQAQEINEILKATQEWQLDGVTRADLLCLVGSKNAQLRARGHGLMAILHKTETQRATRKGTRTGRYHP
jgi:hypothetical protein